MTQAGFYPQYVPRVDPGRILPPPRPGFTPPRPGFTPGPCTGLIQSGFYPRRGGGRPLCPLPPPGAPRSLRAPSGWGGGGSHPRPFTVTGTPTHRHQVLIPPLPSPPHTIRSPPITGPSQDFRPFSVLHTVCRSPPPLPALQLTSRHITGPSDDPPPYWLLTLFPPFFPVPHTVSVAPPSG